ncbi:unnamed protein product [Brassica oleracea]
MMNDMMERFTKQDEANKATNKRLNLPTANKHQGGLFFLLLHEKLVK